MVCLLLEHHGVLGRHASQAMMGATPTNEEPRHQPTPSDSALDEALGELRRTAAASQQQQITAEGGRVASAANGEAAIIPVAPAATYDLTEW